jgi:mono/diheme cytochrome c family protein
MPLAELAALRGARAALAALMIAAWHCAPLSAQAGSASSAAHTPEDLDQPPLPDFIANAYLPRETNPEAVERGQALFQEFACSFCHGADIRGGAGGPSLLRSQLVQRDQAGELIGEVIRNGVPGTAMAGFALTAEQIRDVAEFLHSFPLTSRDPARLRPETIVTGNARAGRRYFNAHCASCHSVDADLAGIGSRIANPRRLQQQWLLPRGAPPVVATVATPETTLTGEVVRIDEFFVTIQTEDGTRRTIKREGEETQVSLVDPLQAHKDLLPMYTDRDIHDVTAYLVTIR